jgi:hypothetical protein
MYMSTVRKPQPSGSLALILTSGARSEAIPVFCRDLLVGPAAMVLRDMVEDAHRETHPFVAAAKAKEALLFSRVLHRLISVPKFLGAGLADSPHG